MKPKALHTWLSRVLYNRRTKMKPLWSTFLVAGVQDDHPFLGEIDKLGTAFTDEQIASGYGAYLALPLLRKAIDEKRAKCHSKLTKDEAIDLLKNCMEVLYYRYIIFILFNNSYIILHNMKKYNFDLFLQRC